MPQLVVQAGHASPVEHLAWSPDGLVFATASMDGAVKVWDGTTGLLRATIRGAPPSVVREDGDGRTYSQDNGARSVAWSPDSTRLVANFDDASVRIWDSRSGASLGSFSEVGRGRAVWSARGLLALWDSTALRVLDPGSAPRVVGQGRDRGTAGIEEARASAAVDAELTTYVTGNGDGSFDVWDVASGTKRTTVSAAHEGPVERISVSPDGRVVASAGRGGTTVRLWNAATGEALGALDALPEGIDVMRWAPNGTTIAVLSRSEIHLFDAPRRAHLSAYAPAERGVRDFAWSEDGATLAVSSESGALALLDPATLVARRTLAVGVPVGSIAFQPHGPRLACVAWTRGSDARDFSVRLFDVASGTPIGSPLRDASGITGQRAAWSPDGSRILAEGGGAPRLWDAHTGTLRATLEGPQGLTAIAWKPDGSLVAGLDLFDAMRIWDGQTGAVVRTLPIQGRSIAWSPDGSLFAVGREDEASRGVEIWDGALGRRRRFLSGADPFVAWSPDSTRLVVGKYDGTVEVRDAGSGRVRTSFRAERSDGAEYTFLTWSPNGTLIASAARRGIQLWNASTGALVRTLSGHEVEVQGCAFSRDGSRLASWALDDRVIVWDVGTGAQVRTLDPYVGSIATLDWSPDGRTLLVSGDSFRLLRIEDARSLAIRSFRVGDRDVGLAYTEDGFFSGDDEAFSQVRYRLGDDLRTADLVTADQLFERFHRPALVSDFLGGDRLAPAADVAQGVGLPPTVEVAVPARIETERIEVRVRATDRGGGVGEIRVFVNGARADDGRGGGFSGAPSGAVVERTVPVVLSPGDNEIVAEAYGVTGRVRSERAVSRVRLGGEAIERPDLHLLAVTLDQYDDPAQALSFANADGDGVVEAFRAQENRLYARVHVTRLADRQATQAGMGEALARLRGAMKTSDVFILYAAGHGMTATCAPDPAPRYRFLTYLSSLRAERTICEQAVSDTMLAQAVRAMPARKKLLVLDTCQAGAAASGEMVVAMRGAEEIDAIKRLARAEGVAVVAAASATQYAGEVRELGHGLFTYALLEGIDGAASPGGPAVTVFQLLAYLQDRVASLSQRYFQRSQYPITSTQGQDFPVAMRAQ